MMFLFGGCWFRRLVVGDMDVVAGVSAFGLGVCSLCVYACVVVCVWVVCVSVVGLFLCV